jgi:hypothetical protein
MAMLQWGQPVVFAARAYEIGIITVGGMARANLMGFWQKGHLTEWGSTIACWL